MVSVILLSRGSYKCLAAASGRMTTYGQKQPFNLSPRTTASGEHREFVYP